MTGPEHYAEAERLLKANPIQEPGNIDRAQVHATLALAAATDRAARPGTVNLSDVAMPTGYGR